MNVCDAITNLQVSLTKDAAGTYRLPCRKAFMKISLQGVSHPLLFNARDDTRFRLDQQGLTIEQITTGVGYQFAWKDIESLAIGEPETDNGPLFQG